MVDGAGGQYRLLRAGEEVWVGWGYALTSALASAYLWIPLTALAFWLTWRWPLERGSWRRNLWVHLAAGLGAHLFRVAAILLLNPAVGWYQEMPALPQLVLHNLVNNIFLFWLVVGVAHALHFAGKARERGTLLHIRDQALEVRHQVGRQLVQPPVQ